MGVASGLSLYGVARLKALICRSFGENCASEQQSAFYLFVVAEAKLCQKRNNAYWDDGESDFTKYLSVGYTHFFLHPSKWHKWVCFYMRSNVPCSCHQQLQRKLVRRNNKNKNFAKLNSAIRMRKYVRQRALCSSFGGVWVCHRGTQR